MGAEVAAHGVVALAAGERRRRPFLYHEIYRVKTAEAIFEQGCRPAGAARIATASTIAPGEGQSRQRQERFAEAAGVGARWLPGRL